MKFTKVFHGVPNGGIYPVEYQPGEVCPPELAFAAAEAEALEEEKPQVVQPPSAKLPVGDASPGPVEPPIADAPAAPPVEQAPAAKSAAPRKKKQ